MRGPDDGAPFGELLHAPSDTSLAACAGVTGRGHGAPLWLLRHCQLACRVCTAHLTLAPLLFLPLRRLLAQPPRPPQLRWCCGHCCGDAAVLLRGAGVVEG